MTLSDGEGENSFAQTNVAILAPAPEFAAPGLVLSSTSIGEGDTVNVSGTMVSPGGIDANTVTLDWGDGSPPTTIPLNPGEFTFSTSHPYLNNPAGVASETYAINASGDQAELQGRLHIDERHRQQVAPQFTAADLNLSEPIANEGDTVTLDGQFTDPDSLSSYTVTIDWGDGSTPTVLRELVRPGRPVRHHAGPLHLLDARTSTCGIPPACRPGALRHPRLGHGRCEHDLGRHIDRREQRGADGADPELRQRRSGVNDQPDRRVSPIRDPSTPRRWPGR